MTPADLRALAARVESEERRCGTCRFFGSSEDEGHRTSNCAWQPTEPIPVPPWVWDTSCSMVVDHDYGTDCPTWEAKPDA